MLPEEQKYGHYEQPAKTITLDEEGEKWFKLLFDDLSVRAKNVLLTSDIKSLEDLTPWLVGTSNTFLTLRNCGKNTSAELMEMVRKLREHMDCLSQTNDEIGSEINKSDMQSNIHELFKTYVDFIKSIYDATKVTLTPATRAYFDTILKFPKSSDRLIAQIVVFLTNPIGCSNTPWQFQLKYKADECSRYAKQLFNLYNNKTVFEVFRHRESIEFLYKQLEGFFYKQYIRFAHAFERYFYTTCGGSILGLYYLICISDIDNAKYPSLGNENSRSMYLLLQEIRKFIEDSVVDTDPLLIKKKIEWHSLFSDSFTVNFLSSKYKQLGYFPFFTAVNLTLLSKEEKATNVLRMCSKIYAEDEMKSLADVGKMNDLTRERVRQIRSKQFRVLQSKIVKLSKTGCLEGYKYNAVKDYELKNIASREEVPFNSNFMVWVICQIDGQYKLIGDVGNAFFKSPTSTEILYAVPKVLCNHFDFKKYIESIEVQLHEKHFYEERIELEQYVSRFCKRNTDNDTFYEIVKECRNILERGYPDIIINSQIVFPVNARKQIPYLVEDLLREFDRPMNVDEISEQLISRFPDLEPTPSQIRSALRNKNIVAVSRTSTYALSEWNQTEKRGGTIREMVVEYLNNLNQPIATLSEICDYIAKFRTDVKENSVKANLLAEANNRFSLYFKDGIQYIGFTDGNIGDDFIKQEKSQGRRSFSDSLARLEQFIKDNGRFPYTSGVDEEEARLSRFYNVSLGYLRKGVLSDEEVSEIERITTTYGHLKVKKDRVSWDQWLERFVKHITENNTLPRRSSPEYAWYEENKALFEAGQLTSEQTSSFAFLNKIIARMK